MRIAASVVAASSVVAVAASGPVDAPEPSSSSSSPNASVVIALDAELRTRLGLPDGHEKLVRAGAVAVVGSDGVRDVALLEAAHLIVSMTAGRPELLDAIADAGVRFVVMAPTEVTTDVPEHSDLEPAGYWDRRARGLGATRTRPAVSCGEENLLGIAGDPYVGESILVHEFAHVVHEFGLAALDPTFDGRLRAAFERAMSEGRWGGTYASTNRMEWFAEASQSFFDTNRQNDAQHGAIDTRDELKVYDPALHALLVEAYGEIDWRYEPVTERIGETHLAAWDPAAAEPFRWSESVLRAWARHQRASAGTPIELQAIRAGSAPPSSTAGGARTTVRFVNRTARSVRLAWIDTLGQLRDYGWVAGGGERSQVTFAGHTWLVLDADSEPLGWATATDAPGRVTLERDAAPDSGG